MGTIRRSGILAALALATAMVAAPACSDDEGPDRVASPTATEAEPATTDAAPATEPATTEPAPVTEAPVDDVEPPPGFTALAPAFAVSPDDEGFVPVQWLVPWDGGFLAVGVEYTPRPLPAELPPEVAELLSPEVNDLFADGLPADVETAMQILDEAGLIDEVMAVVEEHPEVWDALETQPVPDPQLVGWWSEDGGSWTPMTLDLPDDVGQLAHLVSQNGRLTVVGAAQPGSDATATSMTVASTVDLVSWTAARFEVPDTGDVAPEEAHAFPLAVAATDDIWAVRTVSEAAGDPASETTMLLWSAPWSGNATSTPVADLDGALVATDEGILDLGEHSHVTVDGATWSPITTPEPNLWVRSAAPFEGGAVAVVERPGPTHGLFRIDATGSVWDEIAAPADVGEVGFVWPQSSSPVFVVETGPYAYSPPDRIVVEHEGFELTIEYGAVEAYELVDVATGEVVAAESFDLTTTERPDDGPFEHLVEDGTGITVTDPTTGATIVEIPGPVVGRAWQRAWNELDVGVNTGPDWWVLAAGDGESWIVFDHDEGDGPEPMAPYLVAANDEHVIVGGPPWDDGGGAWYRVDLP